MHSSSGLYYGSLFLDHCSFLGNSCISGGSGLVRGGGIYVRTLFDGRVSNSLFYGNIVRGDIFSGRNIYEDLSFLSGYGGFGLSGLSGVKYSSLFLEGGFGSYSLDGSGGFGNFKPFSGADYSSFIDSGVVFPSVSGLSSVSVASAFRSEVFRLSGGILGSVLDSEGLLTDVNAHSAATALDDYLADNSGLGDLSIVRDKLRLFPNNESYLSSSLLSRDLSSSYYAGVVLDAVSSESLDFGFSSTSVVVDKGDPRYGDGILYDLLGSPRRSGDGYDLGSFEFYDPYACGSSVDASAYYVDVNSVSIPDDRRTGNCFASAFLGLDAAISAYSSQVVKVKTRVFLAGGTYRGSVSLPAGLSLYGGFSSGDRFLSDRRLGSLSSTVLSGDVNGDDVLGNLGSLSDNVSVVLTLGSGSSDLVYISGLVIEGGNHVGSGALYGSGLVLSGAVGDVSIIDVVVRDNRVVSSAGGGGGSGFYYAPSVGSSSEVSFLRCRFLNNLVESSAMSSASFYVSGVVGSSSSLSLSRCLFEGNVVKGLSVRGGGVCAVGPLSLEVLNSIFHSNLSSSVSGLSSGGGLYVSGCTFSSNHCKHQQLINHLTK